MIQSFLGNTILNINLMLTRDLSTAQVRSEDSGYKMLIQLQLIGSKSVQQKNCLKVFMKIVDYAASQ